MPEWVYELPRNRFSWALLEPRLQPSKVKGRPVSCHSALSLFGNWSTESTVPTVALELLAVS